MFGIREWLESIGLGHYADAFEENAVDVAIVPKLTEDHLKGPQSAGNSCSRSPIFLEMAEQTEV